MTFSVFTFGWKTEEHSWDNVQLFSHQLSLNKTTYNEQGVPTGKRNERLKGKQSHWNRLEGQIQRASLSHIQGLCISRGIWALFPQTPWPYHKMLLCMCEAIPIARLCQAGGNLAKRRGGEHNHPRVVVVVVLKALSIDRKF